MATPGNEDLEDTIEVKEEVYLVQVVHSLVEESKPVDGEAIKEAVGVTAIKKKVLENEVKEEDLENDQDGVEEDDLEEEVPDDEAKIEEHEVAKIEKHKSPVYGPQARSEQVPAKTVGVGDIEDDLGEEEEAPEEEIKEEIVVGELGKPSDCVSHKTTRACAYCRPQDFVKKVKEKHAPAGVMAALILAPICSMSAGSQTQPQPTRD